MTQDEDGDRLGLALFSGAGTADAFEDGVDALAASGRLVASELVGAGDGDGGG